MKNRQHAGPYTPFCWVGRSLARCPACCLFWGGAVAAGGSSEKDGQDGYLFFSPRDSPLFASEAASMKAISSPKPAPNQSTYTKYMFGLLWLSLPRDRWAVMLRYYVRYRVLRSNQTGPPIHPRDRAVAAGRYRPQGGCCSAATPPRLSFYTLPSMFPLAHFRLIPAFLLFTFMFYFIFFTKRSV